MQNLWEMYFPCDGGTSPNFSKSVYIISVLK